MASAAPTSGVGEAAEPALPVAVVPIVRPARLAVEWGAMAALWRRDMSRLRAEPTRWLGVVLQPLLFWAIIGFGMADVFVLRGAEDVDYAAFFYPGVLTMVVLFTTIFGTIGVIEDRQSGFLQGVVAAPASRLSLVLGKVAGVTSLALVQAALFLAVAPWAGVSLVEVRWLWLLVVLVLTSVGLTAASLSFAWILRSAAAYHGLMSVVLLPLWIVSGAMFPSGGGGVLGAIMVVNPMRYAVDGLRACLGGPETLAAAHSVSLATSVGVLGACAAAALLLASWVCSREGGRA